MHIFGLKKPTFGRGPAVHRRASVRFVFIAARLASRVDENGSLATEYAWTLVFSSASFFFFLFFLFFNSATWTNGFKEIVVPRFVGIERRVGWIGKFCTIWKY